MLNKKKTILKLSVIIVSYKVRFYIEQCLYSLFRAVDGIETEVYVVDNHSGDGSVEYLTQKFPDVNVISSNRNLGFSRANNIAIKQCVGEYVLLLNPDTIVGEHTISDVLGFMDNYKRVGAAGVMMLKDTGEKAMESRRGVPTPMTSFYKMSGLCARYPNSRRFAHYYMSYLSWDEPAQIEIISGAFCMLRREALDKVGLLDEDFFMYGEDIDLSYRFLKAGYENWYIPTKILHYKGESTHSSSFRYVHVFYDAMLIFMRKHYGHFSIFVSLPLKIAIYFKALLALISMQMQSARKLLGLVRPHTHLTTLYVFIGKEEHFNDFNRLAKRHGVDAMFVEGSTSTLPNGHLGQDFASYQCIYATYDIEAYSYEDIFNIFYGKPQSNVLMGTYNPKTQTIITSEEVLR